MLKKIIGPFHFRLEVLGTEILAVTLFTEEDQGLGDWDDDDDDDDGGDDDEDPGDDPDPSSATDDMLDALNEMWRTDGQ